jgi:hypothetical protein
VPEGTAPAEEDRGEVDEVAFRGDVVVHHEPVRIPISALPPRVQPPVPAFPTTLVIGSSGALWFAAALVTGATTPVVFALAWSALLVLDFRHNLKR